MRTIPATTDPLMSATTPAITSTAARIHKMLSAPPLAASIPRAPSMLSPFTPWQQYRSGRSAGVP
jgi:hypothetical protein